MFLCLRYISTFPGPVSLQPSAAVAILSANGKAALIENRASNG